MPPVDLWECDEDLRHAARLLELERPDASAMVTTRFDPAHESLVIAHFPRLRSRAGQHSLPMPASLRVIWGAASLASWLGTVAMTCGAVLLGWSLWAGREPLWAIGVPIFSGGLCALSTGALVRPAATRQEDEPAATARRPRLAPAGPGTH